MDQDIRQLPCQLTPEEIDTRARLLARKLVDRNEAEEEKKAAAKVAADRIKEMDTEIDKLAEAVNTGKERRPIPVTERSDPRRFCVETIRHDTMAVIESRAMTSDEVAEAQQPTLFDERSTAQSRDDDPPAEDVPNASAAAPEPGPYADAAAPGGDECSYCAQVGTHLPDCKRAQVCGACGIVGGDHRPDCARDEVAADALVTDPAALLSGKPDGTA